MFRFRAIPFLATVVVIAIGLALGEWQARRAQEKESIEATLATRESDPPLVLSVVPKTLDAIEYRRVLVTGEFVRDWPVYLDNRPLHGAAGLYLLMPLKIAGSEMYVMIARGWIQRDRNDRTKLPSVVTPTGLVQVEGMAKRNAGHLLQLGRAEELRPGATMQNVEIAEFSAASKLPMQPFIIEQQSPMQDGLIRDWPRSSAGADKHRGYAFQWRGLAAMALLFYLVTGFRRESR
jgi:cytochrome oxidase assembly protein ShyY1